MPSRVGKCKYIKWLAKGSGEIAAEQLQRKVDKIKVTEISAALVRKFLTYLKEIRHCGTNTHNQRLAAIHALAVFVANRSPEHLAWCSEVRAVPFKKSVVHYLDKLELDAMLAVARQRQLTAQGRRDYAMLLFLYNTGARADEAARLKIADLHLTPFFNGVPTYLVARQGGNVMWSLTREACNNQQLTSSAPHNYDRRTEYGADSS